MTYIARKDRGPTTFTAASEEDLELIGPYRAAINDMADSFALADTVWPGAATEPCLCEVDGYGFTERLLGALKTPSAKAVPAVIGM